MWHFLVDNANIVVLIIVVLLPTVFYARPSVMKKTPSSPSLTVIVTFPENFSPFRQAKFLALVRSVLSITSSSLRGYVSGTTVKLVKDYVSLE